MPYYPPASGSDATKLPLAGGTMTGTITSTIGSITASTPVLTATQTWNNAAVAFKGIFFNLTKTASAAASTVIDVQVGGTSQLSLDNGLVMKLAATGGVRHQTSFYWTSAGDAPQVRYIQGNNLLRCSNTFELSIAPGSPDSGAGDVGLARNAAGVMEINDENAGTFRDLKLRELFATQAIRSSGATFGIGYSTGAGGAVTQLTDKATGVTLNKVTGQITMNAAALAAGAVVTFTLTDSAIAATDILLLNHRSGGTPGPYLLNAQAAAGTATINVRNTSAGSLSEAIVIAFAVLKGVTA